MSRPHLADKIGTLVLSPHNTPEYTVDVSAGVVEEMPRRSRVLIYGAGVGCNEAPLDDPSWSVWALNTVAPYDSEGRLRCDRWFDIHQRCAQNEQDLLWIANCPVPIYVPPDLTDMSPLCVRFPLERIEHAFGQSYWACTFAYQIALALLEGYTDIGIYGAELAYGTRRERTVEWANVSWWMGYARARGVVFHLPSRSRLTRHAGRYGVEYAEEKAATERYIDLVDAVDIAREGPSESVGG